MKIWERLTMPFRFVYLLYLLWRCEECWCEWELERAYNRGGEEEVERVERELCRSAPSVRQPTSSSSF